MNFHLITEFFTLNVMQLLIILLLSLLFIVAVLFVFCRWEMIKCIITGKQYTDESEGGDRRFCDRRLIIGKKVDRRSGERRSTGIFTS